MSEPSDLSLVDRLELRLAGCGTTEQLEACTTAFLVPLLHKLSTTAYPSVRQRALQILVHWSRRLRAEESVGLPIPSLLDLLHGAGGYDIPVAGQALPLLLMFLQVGIPRLQGQSDAYTHLPRLALGASTRGEAAQKLIFSCITHLLATFPTTTGLGQPSTPLDLITVLSRDDLAWLLNHLSDFMCTARRNPVDPKARPPPGLSPSSLAFLAPLGTANFQRSVRMGTVQLLVLESHTLLLTDIPPPIPAAWLSCLLVASEDPDEGIASVAGTLFKQCPPPNVEDSNLVERLQLMFLGSPFVRLEPMIESIRLRILRLLEKSVLSCQRLSDSFQIVQACLSQINKAGLRTRIPEEGLQFARWIIQEAPEMEMNRRTEDFYHAIFPFLNNTSIRGSGAESEEKALPDTLLLQVYATLGALCHRCPQYFQASLPQVGLAVSSDHPQNTSLTLDTFRACEDPTISASVRSGIRDVLSTLLQDVIVPWVQDQEHKGDQQGKGMLEKLFPLLAQWSHSSVSTVRYCAVRYVSVLYGHTSHIPAALLCLEAMTDDQGGIREVAREGLYGVSKGGKWMGIEEGEAQRDPGKRMSQLVNAVMHQGNRDNGPSHSPGTLLEIVRYTYYLFLISASRGAHLSPAEAHECDGAGQESREVRGPAVSRLRAWFLEQERKKESMKDNHTPLSSLLGLLSMGMKSSSDHSNPMIRGNLSLVDTCILLASHLTHLGIYRPYWPTLSGHWSLLREVTLGTGLWSVRCRSARIMAYITLAGYDHGETSKVQEWLEELKTISRDPKGKKEAQEGSRYILAASLSRSFLLGISSSKEVAEGVQELLQVSKDVLKKAEDVGGESLDQSGLPTLLSLEELVKSIKLSSLNASLLEDEGILPALLRVVGEGRRVGPRIRDVSLRCLGWMGIQEEMDKVARPLLENTLPKVPSLVGKRPEGLDSAGEVLVLVLFGTSASLFTQSIDLSSSLSAGEEVGRVQLLSITLNLLETMSESDKAWERRASAIWARTLLKETDQTTGDLTGHLSLEQVRRLHQVACTLLGSNEKMIQVASLRALLHAYRSFPPDTSMTPENGGDQGQTTQAKGRALLDDLKISLTRPSRSAAGDDAGGDAPIQVIKVMLTLAEAIGDSLLVYPLLELGLLSSTMTSRKVGSVHVPDELKERLRQLDESKGQKGATLAHFIPHLYRTKHYPVDQVREASQKIWETLVEGKDLDSKIQQKDQESPPLNKTGIWEKQEVKEGVMSLLVTSLTDRIWEVRESSALGLIHLVGSNPPARVLVPHLEDAWKKCFLIADDIKGSVREVAKRLLVSLRRTTLRLVEGTLYEEDEEIRHEERQYVLGEILNHFLDTGLACGVEEVRKETVKTLVALCKSGTSASSSSSPSSSPSSPGPSAASVLLRPYIPRIVLALVEGLTVLEPQVLNYLSFHVESYDMTTEQLEGARLSATRASPLMEAIEECCKHLTLGDANQGNANGIRMGRQLAKTIRRAIGLPSRLGCARVIVLLCEQTQHAQKKRQGYSGGRMGEEEDKEGIEEVEGAKELLKALSGALLDRSGAVVRRAWAGAAAHLVSLVPFPVADRFIRHLYRLYGDVEGTEGEDGSESPEARGGIEARAAVAVTVSEMHRYAGELVRGEGAIRIIPLHLLGRHDGDEEVRRVWEDSWDSGNALSLGTTSAMRMYADPLVELCCRLVEASGRWDVRKQAALTLVEAIDTSDQGMKGHVGRVTRVLVKALGGRTWDGKEGILRALTSLSTHFPEYYASHAEEEGLVLDVLVKECGRKKLLYKRHALTGLAQTVRAFGGSSRERVYGQVQDGLMGLVEQEVDDLSEDGGEEEGGREGEGKAAFLLAQATALDCLGATWFPGAGDGARVIQALRGCLEGRGGGAWNVRIKAGDVMVEVMTRWMQEEDGDYEAAEAIFTIQVLRESMKDRRFGAVRKGAAETMMALWKLWRDTSLGKVNELKECVEEGKKEGEESTDSQVRQVMRESD